MFLKRCVQGWLLAALMVAGASGQDDTTGGAAPTTNSTTATQRFIPVELWTGAPWDGSYELRMNPAQLAFGTGGRKTIAGPTPWTRPSTGETLQVYERNNQGKKQLFTLSSRGDGLGRVFDSRYGRDCIDEVKFPLGWWGDGETRVFGVLCNGGTLRRTISLTIEKLDFSYWGAPHSLQFHWVVDDGKAAGTNMRYVYSPGRGLVWVEGD